MTYTKKKSKNRAVKSTNYPRKMSQFNIGYEVSLRKKAFIKHLVFINNYVRVKQKLFCNLRQISQLSICDEVSFHLDKTEKDTKSYTNNTVQRAVWASSILHRQLVCLATLHVLGYCVCSYGAFRLVVKLVANNSCYWLKQIKGFILAKSRCCLLQVDRPYCTFSRVCYGIMRASLEVNVHFHTNESTWYMNFEIRSAFR